MGRSRCVSQHRQSRSHAADPWLSCAQARVLLFDLLERTLTNSKKDAVQKVFNLDDIER